MSCLAPAPLSDLVTKNDLAAVDEKVAGLNEKVVGLDTKVAGLNEKVAGFDTKVDALVAQRAEDRVAGRVRHYWLAGIGLTAVVSIWLDAAGVIG